MRPAVVEAAGGLVWRVRQGRLQVALVHRPRYKDWSWPKGKLEPGEHPVTAAVREVEEETGLPVVLGRPLTGLTYRLSDGRPKRVHYWAAQVAGRSLAPALHAREPVHLAGSDEIDRVRWMDTDEAHRRLTRRADARPLEDLVDAHRRGRLDTRTVVVVRHGRARKRSAWSHGEDTRPLTPVGRQQAAALVLVLAAYGVGRVVTSPWARCEDTVDPYLRAAGLPVEQQDTLTEAAHHQDPGRTAAAVSALFGADLDVALCTHRPVLPTVVEQVAARSGRRVREALPAQDPYLRPGEVLVAHVHHGDAPGTGDRVVAVEHHRPVVG